MGKKYIVEIGRLERLYKAYVNGNGKPNLTWLSPEVDLTPYTEPDLEQVRKEAYQKGYETGYEDGYNEPGKNQQEAYQRGLNDAWDAARKIVIGDINFIGSAFGSGTRSGIIRDLTASEVIKVLKDYEQEQDAEIKVGDEVELKCGVRPAIYMQGSKGSDKIYLLFNDGSCGLHSKSEIERKTGRHFPEIVAVLEKMRGETND